MPRPIGGGSNWLGVKLKWKIIANYFPVFRNWMREMTYEKCASQKSDFLCSSRPQAGGKVPFYTSRRHHATAAAIVCPYLRYRVVDALHYTYRNIIRVSNAAFLSQFSSQPHAKRKVGKLLTPTYPSARMECLLLHRWSSPFAGSCACEVWVFL